MSVAEDVALLREPTFSLLVPIRARPKGSLKPVTPRGGGRTRLVEDNKRSKPTLDAVKKAMQEELARHPRRAEFPLDCPVEVTVTFFYVPPGNAGPLDRPSTVRTPDVDKAKRLILDALTQAKVLTDDARVVGLLGTAWYDPRDAIQITVCPARGNDGQPLPGRWPSRG